MDEVKTTSDFTIITLVFHFIMEKISIGLRYAEVVFENAIHTALLDVTDVVLSLKPETGMTLFTKKKGPVSQVAIVY